MSVPAAAEPNTSSQSAEAPSTGQPGATPAQEQRAGPTPASSAGTQEQATRTPDYVREAFAQLRGRYTQSAAPAPSEPQANGTATDQAAQAPPASSVPVQEPERPAAQPTAPTERSSEPLPTTLPRQRPQESATQSGQIVLTEAELQRRVQAEADRILAKQRKDDEARAAQERERELRRTDPFAYARMMEDKETELAASRAETQRLTDIVGQQLVFYDRAVLDTFVGALPEDDRLKVIAKEGDGIENRKLTAGNTLKALRNRYLAEGRASAKAELMKDQTFIKEILARYGQVTPEPQPAPVAVRPASEAAPQDGSVGMNAWIRAGANQARTTTGR